MTKFLVIFVSIIEVPYFLRTVCLEQKDLVKIPRLQLSVLLSCKSKPAWLHYSIIFNSGNNVIIDISFVPTWHNINTHRIPCGWRLSALFSHTLLRYPNDLTDSLFKQRMRIWYYLLLPDKIHLSFLSVSLSISPLKKVIFRGRQIRQGLALNSWQPTCILGL